MSTWRSAEPILQPHLTANIQLKGHQRYPSVYLLMCMRVCECTSICACKRASSHYGPCHFDARRPHACARWVFIFVSLFPPMLENLLNFIAFIFFSLYHMVYLLFSCYTEIYFLNWRSILGILYGINMIILRGYFSIIKDLPPNFLNQFALSDSD